MIDECPSSSAWRGVSTSSIDTERPDAIALSRARDCAYRLDDPSSMTIPAPAGMIESATRELWPSASASSSASEWLGDADKPDMVELSSADEVAWTVALPDRKDTEDDVPTEADDMAVTCAWPLRVAENASCWTAVRLDEADAFAERCAMVDAVAELVPENSVTLVPPPSVSDEVAAKLPCPLSVDDSPSWFVRERDP